MGCPADAGWKESSDSGEKVPINTSGDTVVGETAPLDVLHAILIGFVLIDDAEIPAGGNRIEFDSYSVILCDEAVKSFDVNRMAGVMWFDRASHVTSNISPESDASAEKPELFRLEKLGSKSKQESPALRPVVNSTFSVIDVTAPARV